MKELIIFLSKCAITFVCMFGICYITAGGYPKLAWMFFAVFVAIYASCDIAQYLYYQIKRKVNKNGKA